MFNIGAIPFPMQLSANACGYSGPVTWTILHILEYLGSVPASGLDAYLPGNDTWEAAMMAQVVGSLPFT